MLSDWIASQSAPPCMHAPQFESSQAQIGSGYFLCARRPYICVGAGQDAAAGNALAGGKRHIIHDAALLAKHGQRRLDQANGCRSMAFSEDKLHAFAENAPSLSAVS